MQSLRSRLRSAESRPWPDRPVPIAMVITDLDVGGAEKALVALATRLDRSRWQPSVVCLGAEGPLAAPLREAGISVLCLDADRRRPLRAVGRLARAFRALRPALVQSFLFHANVAAKLAAPLAGRPWVIGGLRVAERQKRWHLTLDRLTQGLSAGSVCVSAGVRDFAIREGGIAPDRLVVIPNGIDPAPYDVAVPVDRETLGLRGEDRILLFVGRIAAQKALPILLDAFGSLARSRPEWRLVIAGDGPDRPALQAATESDPILRDRVLWLGRRGDVPSLMKAADLFVLPSLWEGMPNVVLEAMAARLPVLAADVEGIAGLVSASGDHPTGWVTRPNDRGALASDLLRAASETENYALFGANGRRRVETSYRMEAVVASYEYVWEAVLGLRRGLLDGSKTGTHDFGFKPDEP